MTSTAALADVTDVEAALLRPLTDNEQNYVPTLIIQASSLLRTAEPSVDTRITAFPSGAPSALDPTTVAAVIAGAVKRYMVNPTGIASTSNTVGPGASSVTYALRSEKESRGVLQITPDDISTLFPNRKRLRAGTIRTRAALAPRPVGRYGPLPSRGEAVQAIVEWHTGGVLSDTEDPLLIVPNRDGEEIIL